MDWRLLTLEPVDIIVGSDHRSFDDTGYTQDAELSPLAFAGALRTYILASQGYDFRKSPDGQASPLDGASPNLSELGRALGVAYPHTETPPIQADQFSVFGPLHFTERSDAGVMTLWPTPRAVVREKHRDRMAMLAPPLPTSHADANNYLCDAALQPCRILSSALSSSQPVSQPCELHTLVRWLSGGTPHFAHLRPNAHTVETRTGHRRNDRGVAEDQALFSRESRRFIETPCQTRGHRRLASGYALLARIHGDWLPPEKEFIVRLGGDGHTAIARYSDPVDAFRLVDHLRQTVIERMRANDRGGLLIYLASPAIFDDGWRPAFTDASHGAKLVAAALDPPRVISGWDVALRTPKHLLRAVPAGATYYFEVTNVERAIECIVSKYHLNESISTQHRELGFGLALCGIWNHA